VGHKRDDHGQYQRGDEDWTKKNFRTASRTMMRPDPQEPINTRRRLC
jgi:hypothetical protein